MRDEIASEFQCEGWSGSCESKQAKRRRQNTQYVDDKQNWVTLCDDCFKECEEHWRAMWDEYYRGVM